ncbi:carboxypeptidase-like regulatory domain-containing protein, partial [Psychroserpens mesophilus]|uniref:carboxypeptidase-like regulatory domain-containing protein n=1 Tax=Psychroserpens mesophilus TaxID=325473 RepID=UPI003F496EAA
MKSLLNFIVLMLCSLTSYSQSFSVSGTVIDADNISIEFANIILLSEDESEVLKGTSTDDNGFFSILNLEEATYVLKISYIGFESFNQKIILRGNLDLQTIQLNEAS